MDSLSSSMSRRKSLKSSGADRAHIIGPKNVCTAESGEAQRSRGRSAVSSCPSTTRPKVTPPTSPLFCPFDSPLPANFHGTSVTRKGYQTSSVLDEPTTLDDEGRIAAELEITHSCFALTESSIVKEDRSDSIAKLQTCYGGATPSDILQSNRMVTVHFYRNPTIVRVHKRTLEYRSGYCRKMWADTIHKADRLSLSEKDYKYLKHISHATFENWVAWAGGPAKPGSLSLDQLFKLYYLAAELGSPGLQNLTIDKIRETYRKENSWPTQERVEYAYQHDQCTPESERLRRFIVACLHFRLMTVKEDVRSVMNRKLYNGELLHDYMRFGQENPIVWLTTDPRAGEGCKFHTHE